MDNNERRWQCVHGCTTFTTVGIPDVCPHCGVGELYPQGDQGIIYEVPDEYYVRETENEG